MNGVEWGGKVAGAFMASTMALMAPSPRVLADEPATTTTVAEDVAEQLPEAVSTEDRKVLLSFGFFGGGVALGSFLWGRR